MRQPSSSLTESPRRHDVAGHDREGLEAASQRVRDAIAAALTEAWDARTRRGRAAASDPQLLAQLIPFATGGKLLRATLLLRTFQHLASRSGFDGADVPVPGSIVSLAVGCELLHTAFLLHDDVIDHDTVRRGALNPYGAAAAFARDVGAEPAQAKEYGAASAILAGDTLHNLAWHTLSRVAVRDRRPALIETFAQLIDDTIAGEHDDVDSGLLRTAVTLPQALRTAANKTALYSFVLPARLAAGWLGLDEELAEPFTRLGGHLGLAYQLLDDLDGAFGDPITTGKEGFSDLDTVKHTPLLVAAADTPLWPAIRTQLHAAERGPGRVQALRASLIASGAVGAVCRLTQQQLDQAARLVAATPGGQAFVPLLHSLQQRLVVLRAELAGTAAAAEHRS